LIKWANCEKLLAKSLHADIIGSRECRFEALADLTFDLSPLRKTSAFVVGVFFPDRAQAGFAKRPQRQRVCSRRIGL
jgi:hypothetical protein